MAGSADRADRARAGLAVKRYLDSLWETFPDLEMSRGGRSPFCSLGRPAAGVPLARDRHDAGTARATGIRAHRSPPGRGGRRRVRAARRARAQLRRASSTPAGWHSRSAFCPARAVRRSEWRWRPSASAPGSIGEDDEALRLLRNFQVHARPGGHPCGNAYHALKDAGYDPEVEKSYGWGALPDFLNTADAARGEAADRQDVGAGAGHRRRRGRSATRRRSSPGRRRTRRSARSAGVERARLAGTSPSRRRPSRRLDTAR